MITLNSKTNVGALIDAFEQGSGTLARLAEHERARIVRDLRALQDLADAPRQTASAAVASKEHTRKGLAKITADALRTAKAAREPHAAAIAKLEADRLALRAREMATPKGDGSLAELLAEREIRDELRRVAPDPIQVFPIYLAALSRNDHATARAMENSPPSFPLLTEDQRAQGDFIKLQKSPRLDEVLTADAIAYVYRSTLAAVDEELAAVASDYGVKDED